MDDILGCGEAHGILYTRIQSLFKVETMNKNSKDMSYLAPRWSVAMSRI